MNKEPTIVINGAQLTEAQAMTVRVSIETFATDLGNKMLGEEITPLYLARIQEIRGLMYKQGRGNDENSRND